MKEGILSKKNLIFVSIASYRDPELLPTIKNLLETAKYPKNLRIGICWQRSKEDKWDTLDPYLNDKRFKIIDVDYRKSKGVCWARHRVQKLYENEKFVLQLDSHHRFVQNWDVQLIAMLKELQKEGIKKPILTTYLPHYYPEKDPEGREFARIKIALQQFTSEGLVWCSGKSFDFFDSTLKPIKARYLAAGFIFTIGHFYHEVKYDPHLYFLGEEINLTVRAFTHGYDFFHPHKIIGWHYYKRIEARKHWTDNKNHVKHDRKSHKRNLSLLSYKNQKKIGVYGFGKFRTLRDYEKFAGIHFDKKSAQKETWLAHEPIEINTQNEEEWEQSFFIFNNYLIEIKERHLRGKPFDRLCLEFYDREKKMLNSFDIETIEFESAANKMEKGETFYRLWRNFTSDVKPKYAILFLHTPEKGWYKGFRTDFK